MRQSSPRRLTRSSDRVLGGVAAGLADYLEADPTIVRVLWVLAVVFGLPLAILGYIVLWIIMPAADAGAPSVAQSGPRADRGGRDNGALILGLVLILVGAVFLLPDRHFLPWFGWRLLHVAWPLVLILVGAMVLMRSTRSGE